MCRAPPSGRWQPTCSGCCWWWQWRLQLVRPHNNFFCFSLPPYVNYNYPTVFFSIFAKKGLFSVLIKFWQQNKKVTWPYYVINFDKQEILPIWSPSSYHRLTGLSQGFWKKLRILSGNMTELKKSPILKGKIYGQGLTRRYVNTWKNLDTH